MKIAFSEISNKTLPFEVLLDDLKFKGELKKINNKLVNCKGIILGSLNHFCDSCGDDLILNLNEDIELILSDGIYKGDSKTIEDVMEFFDGYIDIMDIMHSEVEAFKGDYFYCDKCKNL